MSINNKKIMPTTIMFLVIVGVIVGFKSVFGDANTLVGVAGVTAALSLLGTDYTINPIKNTIYFVGIEVGLGIASYLAGLNAVLGLIITFIVIFFILYTFTYNTKKPTYVAFTLGYLFMLYTPVSTEEMPMRLAGLAFCGLAIMAMQMLVNKNKLKTNAKKTIANSIASINEEIDLIITNEKSNLAQNLNLDIYNNLRDLVSQIYKRIDKDAELPMNVMQALFISKFLESINLTLDKIRNSNDIDNGYNKTLTSTKEVLNSLNEFIEEKITIEEIISRLEKFEEENKEVNSKYYLIFEIQDGVSILKEDLINSKNYCVKKLSQKYFVKNILGKLNDLKNNMHKDSLKFTFALRGALVTSIGVCIVSALDLEYGRWLVFSLSSIVQPYLEASQTKGKERITGTIIGLILFEILFSIVRGDAGRTLIILIVGYISNYQVKYTYQMVCTTVSALGAASMTGDIGILSIERISMVLIGTVVALYANKVILPYKMSEVTKNEIKKSIRLNEQILKKLYDLGMQNLVIDDKAKEILIVNELINKKIDANNLTLTSKYIDDFLYNQRIFMNEIRFLTNNFKKYKKTKKDHAKLFYDIEAIMYKQNTKEEIEKYFENLEDKTSKLILIDILELKENIQKSRDISEMLSQQL
ncbi:FUSC family protein [Paraclostridium bifermentans]|uniref:FUSC family protein n=1 Tax=Paraclostridium bifermentans TaxID=1490 RepID=UPI00359C971B